MHLVLTQTLTHGADTGLIQVYQKTGVSVSMNLYTVLATGFLNIVYVLSVCVSVAFRI